MSWLYESNNAKVDNWIKYLDNNVCLYISTKLHNRTQCGVGGSLFPLHNSLHIFQPYFTLILNLVDNTPFASSLYDEWRYISVFGFVFLWGHTKPIIKGISVMLQLISLLLHYSLRKGLSMLSLCNSSGLFNVFFIHFFFWGGRYFIQSFCNFIWWFGYTLVLFWSLWVILFQNACDLDFIQVKKKMEILRSPNWLLKMRYLNSFGRQMSNVQLNYSSNSIVTCKPALKRKMSSNN